MCLHALYKCRCSAACSQPAVSRRLLLAARQPLQHSAQLAHHRRRAEHLPGALGLRLCIRRPLLSIVAAQVQLGFLWGRWKQSRSRWAVKGQDGAKQCRGQQSCALLRAKPQQKHPECKPCACQAAAQRCTGSPLLTARLKSGETSICAMASSAAACGEQGVARQQR